MAEVVCRRRWSGCFGPAGSTYGSGGLNLLMGAQEAEWVILVKLQQEVVLLN